MTENTTGFERKITAKQMYTRIALLGHEKLKENKDKPDLLSTDLQELYLDLLVEVAEFKKAFVIHDSDPTIENKNKLDREAGDIMNYLSAIVSKSDGYNILIRE